MDKNKASSRDRKVLYIAPVIIGCAIAALIGVILLREPPPSTPVKPPSLDIAAVPSPPQKKVPAVVAPPPPLSRGDLIGYAARVTSAFAATGRDDGSADSLVGRRFSLRLPFGCNGVDGASFNPQTMVSYDAAKQSVTVMAQPADWSVLPAIAPLMEDAKIEAAEGFWLPRPWTDSEACPPRSGVSQSAFATPATTQTLGLAQLFAAGSARTARHAERPYSFTRKIGPKDTGLLAHSYRLLLEGVISGYPDGRALHCWAEAADHHPVCIYAVTLDHVAFLDGESDEALANWTE